LVDANREHLKPWMPWVDATKAVSNIEAFIQAGLGRFVKNNGFELGIRYHKELVGVVGLHYIDQVTRSTELGYWLSQAFEGKGLMSASVKALIEEAFGYYKLNRIEIRCQPTNLRSRAIPKRLGFTQEGVLRQVGSNNAQRFDLVIYSLLQEEWLNTRLESCKADISEVKNGNNA
jgi:ribosomal-protein-serine acetyltransferase